MASKFPCKVEDVFNVTKFLANLEDWTLKDLPIIPSKYISEISKTTQERLQNLQRIRKERIIPTLSSFLVTPDVILFQNFEVGQVYSTPITLRNRTKCCKNIRVDYEPNRYFKISWPQNEVLTKIAPGMSYQVIVSFSAEELKDYKHEVKFLSDSEQATIVLIAVKPRAIINFPDSIEMPPTPVKALVKKTVIIRNRGISLANFSLVADKLCSVKPLKIILAPQESKFLKFNFYSSKKGYQTSTILVHFDSGRVLKILVNCEVVEAISEFDKSFLQFDSTFIGLMRKIRLRITNKSDYVLEFKWKSYENEAADKAREECLKRGFEGIRECETLKTCRLKLDKIVDDDVHALVYKRILQDQIEELEEVEVFAFHHQNFKILPLRGQIGPKESTECLVFFKPDSCEVLETHAYLDIQGQEQRIPLKLSGTGLGPLFKFNVSHIDANKIFLCSEHYYEIDFTNAGDIPGTIYFKENKSEFGGEFSCMQDRFEITAGHYGAFVIKFTSRNEGEFFEKLEFVIDESDESIIITMAGTVIAPLLSLNVYEIDFGVIPLGYEVSRDVILSNASQVPIEFFLEFPDNGFEEPVSWSDYLDGAESPLYPREMKFSVDSGVVDAKSSIEGTLVFLPNLLGNHVKRMIIYMWGSRKHFITLTVNYSAQLPIIQCIPPKIDIKYCFINYVYDRKLKLKNLSKFPGFFRFKPIESGCIEIEADGEIIVLCPDSETEVSLTLKTCVLGLQEAPLQFSFMGKGPVNLCPIILDGQPPTITITDEHVDFGDVKLLTTVERVIEMSNTCPIMCRLCFNIEKPPFMVEAACKTIKPDSDDQILVSVFLTDPGKYKGKLIIAVTDGLTSEVILTCRGIGFSIECDPPLEPELYLGIQSTSKKITVPVIVKNRGQKWYKLLFTQSREIKSLKTQKDSGTSVFDLSPSTAHLIKDESFVMEITTMSTTPRYVEENWYCFAVIEKCSKAVIIFQFLLKVNFVDPAVEVSQSEVHFRIDFPAPPDENHISIKEKLKITNNCGLDMSITFKLEKPFFIVIDEKRVNQIEYHLAHLDSYELCLVFIPPPNTRRCIVYKKKLNILYSNHPKIDYVNMVGEVNFPEVRIYPNHVDFEALTLAAYSYMAVKIKNVSPLPVFYKWTWMEQEFSVSKKFPIDIKEKLESCPKLSKILSNPHHLTVQPKENVVIPYPELKENDCLVDEIKYILNPLVAKYYEDCDKEVKFFRSLGMAQVHEIDTYLNIAPTEGYLEPHEEILNFISFSPLPFLCLKAQAMCHVVGGEEEFLTILGGASILDYTLSTMSIDFGKSLFFEQTQRELILSNLGFCRFDYTVIIKQLKYGYLDVSPKQGVVLKNSELVLNITSIPNVVEKFATVMYLDIAHLEPIPITIKGYGVYNQIYLYLPRPMLSQQIAPEFSYSAVANLEDFGFEFEAGLKDISEEMQAELEQEGWVIVSLNSDRFPSKLDIDLSVERTITHYQVAGKWKIRLRHSKSSKKFGLDDVIVPPYLVDFNYVLNESTVCYTILFSNFGPNRTSVRYINNSGSFTIKGFSVELPVKKLNLDQVYEVLIYFKPTSKKYPDHTTKVFDYFYLEVYKGIRVPVEVTAVVTTPIIDFFQLVSSEINFGPVRCGDCLRKYIKIKNSGFLVSKWKATIENANNEPKEDCSFFLSYSEGVLEPNSKAHIEINFEPKYDGVLEENLTLEIEGNPIKSKWKLKGYGMEPLLAISEQRISFRPCIPYATEEMILSIKNISNIPLEFYFSDSDTQILMEDALIGYYAYYYRLKKIYASYRPPGDKLQDVFKEFYDQLLSEINLKNETRLEESEVTKPNKLKSVSRKILLDSPPKSLEDIHLLTIKYLDQVRVGVNEVENILAGVQPPAVNQEIDKSFLLVFHGAPKTIFLKAAHETGKVLNIPAFSIDRIIIESLLENTNYSATRLNAIIDQTINDVAEDEEIEMISAQDPFAAIQMKIMILLEGRKKKPKKKKPKSPERESAKGKKNKSSKSSKSDKSKSSKKSKSAKSSKKSSKSSKKSKSSGKSKKKKQKIPDTLQNCPQDLLCDILKDGFAHYPNGLVLESLKSNFLRKIKIALDNVLKASTKIKIVHFIIFPFNFDGYMAIVDVKKGTEEWVSVEEQQNIAASIDSMDNESFDKMIETHPGLYQDYIKLRKMQSSERKEQIKNRLLERKLAKNLQQAASKKMVGRSVSRIIKKIKSKQSSVINAASAVSFKKKSEKKSKKGSATKEKQSSKKDSKKSSGSSKISKKDKGQKKYTPEEEDIKDEMDDFNQFLPELIHILEYWDRQDCILTKPYVKRKVKSVKKKGSSKGSSKKSSKKGSKSSKSKKSDKSKKSKSEKSSKDKDKKSKKGKHDKDKPAEEEVKVLPQNPDEPAIIIQEVPKIDILTDPEISKITSETLGVPCWILEKTVNSENATNYLNDLRMFLKSMLDIKLDNEEKEEEAKEIPDLLMSVVDVLQEKRCQKKSNVFTISNDIEPNNQDNLGGTKSVASKISLDIRKRKLSSRKSLLNTLSSNSQNEFKNFFSRVLLQPGQIFKYKLEFNPTFKGDFRHSYRIEVVGWPKSYIISCLGICDIPRISTNPEIIFKRVLDYRGNFNKYEHCIYLRNENLFDFGGILLPFSNENANFDIQTAFCIKNISMIPCEISFALRNNNEVFEFQPKELLIEPNSMNNVILSAMPRTQDIFDDTLIVSIKNNPKIETINLSCFGYNVGVDVNPKYIIFERMFLNFTASKKMTITNSTPDELRWKFINTEVISDHFKLSQWGGKLLQFSLQKVKVEFTATTLSSLPPMNFGLIACDLFGRTVYSTELSFEADVVHVEFDYQDHLDLGEVKGKIETKITFKIINKGKYAADLTFTEIDENNCDDDTKNQRQSFKVTPLSANLEPNKPFTFNIKFMPLDRMQFTDLPIIQATIVDPFHEDILETFQLKVTAKVFLTKYEVCPITEMFFGCLGVGSEKTQVFEIKNSGKFDFNYTIQDMKSLVKKKKGDKKSSKSSKKSKSSKGSKKSTSTKKSHKTDKSKSQKGSKKSGKSEASKKSKKPKITKLKAGIFTITSSTGVLAANETVMVQVKAVPKEGKDYTEKIVIFASEASNEDKKGKTVLLHATGCLPLINFDDLTQIFKEQIIIDKLEDTPQNQNENLFIRSERRLIFKKTCINKTEIARLKIQNSGQVSANIIATLNGSDVFSAVPAKFYVQPYQTENMTISFSPNVLSNFYATLTITCSGTKINPFTINISGEGFLPEISILEPEFKNNFYKIDFPPTFVGQTSQKCIVFKNTGMISCKVVLEVCQDDNEEISLESTDNDLVLLNFWDPNVMKHLSLLNLLPEEVAKFLVKFSPKSLHSTSSNAEIKLSVANNPFDIKSIKLFGQNYYSDVTIEGLLSNFFSKSQISFTKKDKIFGYYLDFGYRNLNLMHQKCFTIKNNSSSVTYKFELLNKNIISFDPSVGHLKPGTFKQIIASFYSKNPVEIKEMESHCKIYQIEYLEPQDDPLSWDERQHFVVWVSYGNDGDDPLGSEDELKIKTIEDKPEPDFKIFPKTTEKIPILINLICDYAFYSCDTTELCFPDTFITEKSQVTFNLNNPGILPLEIEWTLYVDETFPERIKTNHSHLDKSLPRILSLNPRGLKSEPLHKSDNFIEGDSNMHSTSSSTLFSCLEIDSTVSTDSWSDLNPLPFQINPKKTMVPPGETMNFTLTFTPEDTFAYTIHLKSSISNLSTTMENINILVKAASLLPKYYFVLEPSTYLEKDRKGRKMCQDLADSNTKVVEFESVGIGTICTRKFLLKNPGSTEFSYSWKSEKEEKYLSCFHCHTSNGIVRPKKAMEMVFSFIPEKLGIFEEFYVFEISSLDVQISFLLVGIGREPRIYFDKSYLGMPPTILGNNVNQKIVLVNDDKMGYQYKFGKMLLNSNELEINPSYGHVESKEDKIIDFVFKPSTNGFKNFELKCFIEKMKLPLDLKIEANCYEIQASICYSFRNGNKIPLELKKINSINLGGIMPRQKSVINFWITNTGKVRFQWSWLTNCESIESKFNISFSPSEDLLDINKTSLTQIVIEPLIKGVLNKHKVLLKIPFGPVYTLQISAISSKPQFKFSFTEYNFGNCLIQIKPSKYYCTTLQFSNNNCWPITLELGDYSPNMTIQFSSAEIPANSIRSMEIFFHPLTLGSHALNLPFFIEGEPINIAITGKAVPLNLELISSTDRFIDFGSIILGKTCVKTVKVLNKTKCNIGITFDFWERLPFHFRKESPNYELEFPKEAPKKKKEQKGKSKKGSKKGSSKASSKAKKSSKKSSAKTSKKSSKKGSSKISKKDSKKGSKKSGKKDKKKATQPAEEVVVPKRAIEFLSVNPNKFSKFVPEQTVEFVTKFNPKERVEPFTEKIFFEVQDYVEPFCIVKGQVSCPQFSLDKTQITFGSVVVDFETEQNVTLRNSGDIPLKYKWSSFKTDHNFTFEPKSGLTPAQSQTIFTVHFRPKVRQCLIKTKFFCTIENVNKQLEVLITGSCVGMPPAQGTINFSCPVRHSDRKSVPLKNTTNVPWKIIPRIQGQYFSTDQVIEVPALDQTNCEITFAPLVVNVHQATLLLPLPDGFVINYLLKGKTNPPVSCGKIQREILCKVDHNELLAVENWLQVPQQFHVTTSTTGGTSNKILYKLFGNELIDVPGSSYRDYKWVINVMNEGVLNFKVVFTNKKSGEFLFYEISLKVLPNQELKSITFSTCVRIPVTKVIKLENPMNMPIIYKLSCSHPRVVFEKNVTMPAHSVYDLKVVYTPIQTEENKVLLEASCKELGAFRYSLALNAFDPVPEPATNFKASLGQTSQARINLRTVNGLGFKFDNPVFTMDKVETSISQACINFEPNKLGTLNGTLVVSSVDMGDFIFPLIGECFPPKPQGPYILNSSSPLTIAFKNPFVEDKVFYFNTEPIGSFQMKETTATIASRNSSNIVITFIGGSKEYAAAGKLIIKCRNPDISWVYYLQGDVKGNN